MTMPPDELAAILVRVSHTHHYRWASQTHAEITDMCNRDVGYGWPGRTFRTVMMPPTQPTDELFVQGPRRGRYNKERYQK